MARLLSDPAVQAEMEALGTADFVLGLPTIGRTPSAEAVGRAALEGRLGSMATVVVHVDLTGSSEVVEALTRAVAPRPLLHPRGARLGGAPRLARPRRRRRPHHSRGGPTAARARDRPAHPAGGSRHAGPCGRARRAGAQGRPRPRAPDVSAATLGGHAHARAGRP